jgi:hypothetical protein
LTRSERHGAASLEVHPNAVEHRDTRVQRALLLSVRHLTCHRLRTLQQRDGKASSSDDGCSSLFTYCTQVLHFSEHAAYGRIEAARAARKWPIVLELLADGSLHLTAISLLSRHLTMENHQAVLAAARHKSKREVEEIVADLQPRPPVPSTVRKLPTCSTEIAASPSVKTTPDARTIAVAEPLTSPARRSEVKPLAPEQFKVQFTIPRETYDKLRQAQDLLRHRVPNGDVAVIVDRALTLLLAELHKTKHAAVNRARSGPSCAAHGRHVPASVKRAVWDRDGGRCAFVGAAGRCSERGFLEYHHVVPFADGGSTTADNLELRCRAHNAYEADRWFGVGPSG